MNSEPLDSREEHLKDRAFLVALVESNGGALLLTHSAEQRMTMNPDGRVLIREETAEGTLYRLLKCKHEHHYTVHAGVKTCHECRLQVPA